MSRAIIFRLSLSSKNIERADKNPAINAFFLSSLQKRLIMHRIALYRAFKNAAKSANLTESRLDFTLILYNIF